MALLFVTCNRWQEPEFQVPAYSGPAANHTIADIKAKHTVMGTGAQDSICRWNEPFIVKAVVVSSDQGGNCYKYMTIQDETGGIEISIDRSSLYNDYPVGQTIYLDCRGLIVGDYHGKHQIGWKYVGSVGRIHPQALDHYIHKDGMPDPNHPFVANPIEVTGKKELTTENVNCLVRINGCKFKSSDNGKPLATNDMTMDRSVFINGDSVVVRTSNYANFRSTTIDASKKYCLYGILSVYTSSGKQIYQLTLRTKDDIQFAHTTEDILIKDIALDNNCFTSGGWSMFPQNNAWMPQTYEGSQFVYHNATSTECDDWLISPQITLSNLDGVTLRVDQQNTITSQPDYYQVYYSTTYQGGEFNESDWTPFNPNLSDFQSNFSLSNAMDMSVVGNNSFRIALRYHKYGTANGSLWAIRSLKFYQQQQQ